MTVPESETDGPDPQPADGSGAPSSLVISGLTGRPRFSPLVEQARERMQEPIGADPALAAWRHPPDPAGRPVQQPTGICVSGGGIRSASYNLGALQALRERGVLDRADFLAGVSGGGYIAIAHALTACCSDPGAFGDAAPLFGRLSPEENYLRNHTTYLAQGMRGRVWFALNVLAGFLLNAAVVFALLYPTGRILGWLAAGLQPGLQAGPTHPSPGFAEAFSVWWLYPPALLLAILTVARSRAQRSARALTWSHGATMRALLAGLVVGAASLVAFCSAWWLTHRSASPPSEHNQVDFSNGEVAAGLAGLVISLVIVVVLRYFEQHGWAKSISAFRQPAFVAVLVAAAVTFVVIVVPAAILGLRELGDARLMERFDLPAGGPAALLALTASIVTSIAAVYRFARGKGRWLVPLATFLIGPVLVTLIVVGVANGAAARGLFDDSLLIFWGCLAGLLLAKLLVTSNFWSMHSFYRERLSEAFALKRAFDDDPTPPVMHAECLPYRQPLQFSMLEPTPSPGARLPRLIVCCTLNVADDLVPSGRRAASFTFEQHVSGSPITGWVSTRELEGETGVTQLTLPAMMAISGAALAPAMGKHDVVGLRMLFTLLNIRLGVWIPNPLNLDAWRERERRRHDSGRGYRAWDAIRIQWGRPGVLNLILEAIGSTRLDRRYLYITDGGHWENLGLVELLRRRCKTIYCFDASGDAVDTFDTIGEAIMLARTELGVEISLETRPLRRDPDTGRSDRSSVVGTYLLPGDPEPGTLVFVKSEITDDTPWDVRAFAQRNKSFPNQSTLIQLFDDEQFEAYRELGYTAADQALDTLNDAGLRSAVPAGA